jgi:hypothetical protein
VIRRLAIVGAAAVLAAALAVPALAQTKRVVPAIDSKLSQRALAKARVALRTARTAQQRTRRALLAAATAQGAALAAQGGADSAKADADAAKQEAASAKSAAAGAQARLDATKVVSGTESATVASSAPFGEYEAKGGPSVQMTVPASGLIEVWAQVEIKDEEGGAVGLFEDGHVVTGISVPEICGDGSALIDMQGVGVGEFTTFSTPPTPGFLGCANGGAPAPVLLSRPPGPHAYELRYSECSCNPGGSGAEFRNRVLRVAPRP